MMRLLEPDPRPSSAVYRNPWQIDRSEPAHPVITNESSGSADFVRLFGSDGEAQHLGQFLPGEAAQVCLCDVDSGSLTFTVAWFRPEDGKEYLWRFTP